jgi:glycosyltransferase involved in cell wall biosynthesis
VVAQRNEKNSGYTATINKGCRMAGTDDVVLLNSDTVVTSGWLEKLRACAVAKKNVATVTPLSNAAGAFSVPRNNTVNSLPEFMSIEDMARLVETLSPGIRPEVPTGNGFCMYITRRALDQTGGFDEANFPRGYGEENDFCMRAARKGFVHVIDDATFIFHKRSASFGDKKREIIAESTKRLRTLHPDYKSKVSHWLKNDPLDVFRSRLQKVIKYKKARSAKTSLKGDRPVVLYILHSGGGGVFHTSFDLFHEAAKNYHCFLLKTGLTTWQLYEAGRNSSQVVNEFRFSDKWRIHEPLSGQRQNAIKEIASICSPDVVHIRHFLGNHPAVAALFHEMGCRVVFSIHDFYTICPTIQLVDNEGKFCEGVCSAGGGDCDCAKNWFVSMPPLKNGFVFQWRRTVADALKACDALVVTSETTRALMQRHYPFLEDSVFHLIEHGRDFPNYRQCSAFPEPKQSLRAVFFGALGMNKGGPLVKGMLEYNSRLGHPLEMHILGNSNLPFRPGRMGSVYHGAYEREKLPEKLCAIQPAVAIIPSVWPETYCHTLTEAWRAQIPVLGSNLGAVGERILRHGGGWILPPSGPEQWVDKLLAIAGDRAEYQERIEEIRAMRFKTVAEMGAEYVALYNSVLEEVKQEPKVDAG